MAVMTYTELQNAIGKLEERGKTDNHNVMMYVVSPFLQGIEYNTFDLDVVDMKTDEGIAEVTVKDNFHLIITLTDDISQFNNEESKILITMDVENRELKLYFKALGQWEEITKMNLSVKEGQEEEYVNNFIRKIAKEQVLNETNKKGSKFITEDVINGLLEEGNWQNNFTALGLVSELKNPSKSFIRLMAERLHQDYTTKEIEWIEEQLVDAAEDGFIGLLGQVEKNLITTLTGTKEDNISEEDLQQKAEEIAEKMMEEKTQGLNEHYQALYEDKKNREIEKLKEQIKVELEIELEEELTEKVLEKEKQNLRTEVVDEVRLELREQVKEEVKAEIEIDVRIEIEEQIRKEQEEIQLQQSTKDEEAFEIEEVDMGVSEISQQNEVVTNKFNRQEGSEEEVVEREDVEILKNENIEVTSEQHKNKDIGDLLKQEETRTRRHRTPRKPRKQEETTSNLEHELDNLVNIGGTSYEGSTIEDINDKNAGFFGS